MTTEAHVRTRATTNEATSDSAPGPAASTGSDFSWKAFFAVTAILGLGLFVRTWQLMALGFNSDEAVYAGQASSIAGNLELLPYFPVFRAHPLLFQTLISVPYQFFVSPLVGRLMSVAFGLGTVWLVYLVGKTLYTRRIGLIAALFIALMPYHVIVTRQILLDGPLAFFATLSLLFLARYGRSRNLTWFYAAFAAMGLTVITKESGIIMFGAIYIFVALMGTIRLRHLVAASLLWFVVVLPYPVSVAMSGRSSTGASYIAWQLFRRANHPWHFYFTEVPPAMGILVVLSSIAALVLMRKRWTWTETLLTSWIAIPVIFFILFPVKGFQYLLPVAMPLAVLAAVGLVKIGESTFFPRGTQLRDFVASSVGIIIVAASLLAGSMSAINPTNQSTEFLAGSGGVPGGREVGNWVGENTPEGAQILALGPSMANIIQFYGQRKTYGLSVSPNPLHRNPVYEPINNPDLWIRSNNLQYIVWDSYSASRSQFFSDRLLNYVERYNGRIIHSEFVEVKTESGETLKKPAIVVYEVRP